MSKKTSAALSGLEPVKPEIFGQPAAELPEAGEQLFGAGGLLDLQRPLAGGMQDHVVTFPQSECIHD